MTRLKLAAAPLAFMLLCAFCSYATAQTQPWNTNVLNWQPGIGCIRVGGGPVTGACPAVESFRVERAPVSSGPWATLGTTAGTVTTYTHTGAAAGVNCYRIVAIPAVVPTIAPAPVPSPPSGHTCKNNVEPAAPLPPIQPNPPTDLRFVVPIVSNVDHAPVFTVLADGSRSSTVGGLAAVGTPCEGPVLFRYRSKDWRKPVAWKPWSTSATARVAAPCA